MRYIKSIGSSIASFYKDMIIGKERSSDFLPLEGDLIAAEAQYDGLAQQDLLYTFPVDNGRKDSIRATNITKGDLINLYTYYMVASSGRDIYDRILASAENGKCPYCGQRNVRTLDHFLPKSQYPKLSITPLNLIPCCSDCNKDKKDKTIMQNSDLIIHPYYDSNIDSSQWLFCVIRSLDYSQEVIEMDFHVRNVSNFNLALNERILNHFSSLKLDLLYKIEANEEFLNNVPTFEALVATSSVEEVRTHFENIERRYSRRYINSWQRAFYQALGQYYGSM